MEKIPIIAVVGPTASGKTALAVELAKAYDAEVVSFDSMQLYKGMDIATAKPTTEEMQGIPHHMISCVDPSVSYSVAMFKDDATAIIDDIISRGKHVVMVGGTGLYIDTLMQNITFLSGDFSAASAELSNLTLDEMNEKLLSIDPEYAAVVDTSNAKRVRRALEIYFATGKTMTEQLELSKAEPSRYAPIYIGLNARDRDFLYSRIDKRVDVMLENGLVSEARSFMSMGPTAKQAIGIKELMPYLSGDASLETCVSKIKQGTRNYAKRQLTWFRKNPDIHWLYIDEMPMDAIVSEARRIIDEC